MRPKIHRYKDYRKFVRDLLMTYPKKGHGQYRRMAEALRTNTVTISQVFAGKRDLTPEQAVELAEFLALDEPETRYFILLVQLSRAGNEKLREHLSMELEIRRKEFRNLKGVVPGSKEISDEAKAIFYSDWAYSLVRLTSSLPDVQNEAEIAQRTGLPLARVNQILRFLLKLGLVEQTKTRFHMGPASTHLDSKSPYVKSRQLSWRIKAAEYMRAEQVHENLFYTAPFAMGDEEYEWLREEILNLIKQFVARASSSIATNVGCLNIDLFKIVKSKVR